MSTIPFNPPFKLVLRRTRIVATVGPASESSEVLERLIRAGINVARLNFSHGTHDKHLTVIDRIRRIMDQTGIRIAMLGDLSGPKTRVGTFINGSIELRSDEEVKIVTGSKEPGSDGIIPSQYEELIQDVTPGQRILMDDGLLEIVISRIVNEHEAIAKVVKGGTLKDKKGMNLPGAKMSVPAITPKDLADLEFAIKNKLDYVALSFVRKAKEVIELKERILNLTQIHHPELFKDKAQPASCTRVIAKIEKPEALDEITEIIEEADGIMIARGDLGVELPAEQVPIIQTQLIRAANERNKPVIVATQMLESMTENPRPTRAEVNDVATAVRDLTDAVMLSGETAAGMYPVESVEMMNRITREIETYQWSRGRWGELREIVSISPIPNAIARACTLLSHDMEIRAINVLTRAGRLARCMSAARPTCPILAYANDPIIVRQMQMLWGVFPIQIERELTFEAFADVAAETCKKMGIAQAGNHILLVSSPLKRYIEHPLSSIIIYEIR